MSSPSSLPTEEPPPLLVGVCLPSKQRQDHAVLALAVRGFVARMSPALAENEYLEAKLLETLGL
jgi:hypothetical protein